MHCFKSQITIIFATPPILSPIMFFLHPSSHFISGNASAVNQALPARIASRGDAFDKSSIRFNSTYAFSMFSISMEIIDSLSALDIIT
jgi:hypothetical protein